MAAFLLQRINLPVWCPYIAWRFWFPCFPSVSCFFFSSKIIFNFLEYIKSLTGTTLHLTNNIAVVWWSSTTLTLTAVIILVDLAEHVNRSSGARRAGKNAVFKFFLNKNLWRQIVTWKVSVIPIYFSSFLFFSLLQQALLVQAFPQADWIRHLHLCRVWGQKAGATWETRKRWWCKSFTVGSSVYL